MRPSRKPLPPAVDQDLIERAQRQILMIRGYKVLLDSELASLYGVPTKRLNEQVRRNQGRFPPDFMFQLSSQEATDLRSQIATSNPGRGGRRSLPLVFTEQGVAMLSSVLHSERAVQVNIGIMRAFVQLRSMLANHRDLARKVEDMERRYDRQFGTVLEAIRLMMTPPPPRRRPIGFQREEPRGSPEDVSDARRSAPKSGCAAAV